LGPPTLTETDSIQFRQLSESFQAFEEDLKDRVAELG
jgi:hypothetical protein